MRGGGAGGWFDSGARPGLGCGVGVFACESVKGVVVRFWHEIVLYVI